MSDNNYFEGLLQREIGGKMLLRYILIEIYLSQVTEIDLQQNDNMQYIFLQKFTCPTGVTNKNINANYMDYLKLIWVNT